MYSETWNIIRNLEEWFKFPFNEEEFVDWLIHGICFLRASKPTTSEPFSNSTSERLSPLVSLSAILNSDLFCIYTGVTGVHINDLKVPPIIKNGTEENVTLDCDYTLEENEKLGLVVKWYFNNEESPVYQWIPNQRPQDLGILRGKLNLEYKASTDVYKMYRALQIQRPYTNLSGKYFCRVSTLFNDAYKSGTMLVYCKFLSYSIWETLFWVHCAWKALLDEEFGFLTTGKRLFQRENKKEKVVDGSGLKGRGPFRCRSHRSFLSSFISIRDLQELPSSSH